MKEFPAFKFLIVFAVLVYSLNFFKEFNSYFFYVFGLSIITLIILLLLKFKNSAYLLSIFILSITVNYNLNISEIKYPNKYVPTQKAIFTGKILSISDRDSNLRIIAQGDLDAKTLPLVKDTKIILKVSNLESIKIKLRAGCEIYTSLKIRPPNRKLINQDFDEMTYFKTNNFSFYGYAKAGDLVLINEAGFYDKFVDDIRIEIKKRIYSLYSENVAPIAMALLIGDKSDIDNDVRNSFSLTGTAHLLAVSGTHVGVIASIVFVMLGFIFNHWVKFIVFSILIIAFVIITGNQASAIRSGLMAIVVVFGITVERNIHPLNSLSFVSVMMLLYDNSLFYSAGFQMSVGSVLGIILFYNLIYDNLRNFNKKENKILDFVFLSISITISASIVVSPIVAYYFNVFSIISPLANLIEVPMFSIAMIGVIITVLSSFIFYPFAELTAISSNMLIEKLLDINYLFSKIEFSYIIGESTFVISLIISAYLLYLFYSNNLKMLAFRLTFLALFTLIILNIKFDNVTDISIIIPTANYVYTISDTSNKIDPSIYIFDRKVGLRPYTDKYFKYITDNFKRPKIYYCGNYGIALIDYYKNKNQITGIMIQPEFSDTLTQYLKLTDNFIQYIDYEN